MSLNFIGKKKGMTQHFDDQGNVLACTIILAEPNVVIQKKDKLLDGYDAIQTGAIVTKEKVLSKPLKGHFAKAKVEPQKRLIETRVDDLDAYEVGQKFDASYFAVGDYVDISSTSKGKGFQGVMKLHGFSGGPAAHGSGFHRHAGSTGMRSTPGRCFKGGKRASRMGGNNMTVQSLQILAVDVEKNMIAVKGAVPGSNGSIICMTKAIKKNKKKAMNK